MRAEASENRNKQTAVQNRTQDWERLGSDTPEQAWDCYYQKTLALLGTPNESQKLDITSYVIINNTSRLNNSLNISRKYPVSK